MSTDGTNDRDRAIRRLAFAHVKAMNVANMRRFTAAGIGPDEYFSLPASALAARMRLRENLFDDKVRGQLLQRAADEYEFTGAHGIRTVMCTDSAYPRRLAQCDDAPAVLYVKGDADLDAARMVAIVGTRHCTAYGKSFVDKLVADMAEQLDGVTVVSGLAYGVDICAHRAAMAAGLPTVAVVAHGLNTIYPSDHRNDARRMVEAGGAVVSEYRSTDPIHRGNFLARNRIVAGLCDAVIVVESDIKGGAMFTARLGAAYDREVLALPGRTSDVYSRGCNALIAGMSARMIRGLDDLVAACGWVKKPAEGSQKELVFEPTAEQQEVLDFLRANPRATVNEMSEALGSPYSRLSAILFEMEMNDMITALPGARYAPV